MMTLLDVGLIYFHYYTLAFLYLFDIQENETVTYAGALQRGLEMVLFYHILQGFVRS